MQIATFKIMQIATHIHPHEANSTETPVAIPDLTMFANDQWLICCSFIISLHCVKLFKGESI